MEDVVGKPGLLAGYSFSHLNGGSHGEGYKVCLDEDV